MRLRLRFSKIGKVRFVGHRDVARIIERGLRRCGVPVTYSEGFSPRVRLSFGLALPTCYESEAEYLDIPLDPESVVDGDVVCTGWREGTTYSIEQL
ncbi:MAG: TIGR03936 family radical SAM-associated protein, partial [Actinomycetota bacterium]|nr:TIGR03936 family radical SAM-associated protein [Actinomycetota bacterium]